MREYVENGVRLGWLVDVDAKVVWVYAPDGSVQRLVAPPTRSADPVLPGFVVETAGLW